MLKMVVQQGRRRDKHRRHNIPTQPRAVWTALFPSGVRWGFCRAENDARGKARPWARRLYWQTQGGRVK